MNTGARWAGLLMCVAAVACHGRELAECHQALAKETTAVAALTQEVAGARETLDELEYAMESPDVVHGKTSTWATFHGADALLQCEAKIAEAKLNGIALLLYCAKQ